MMMINNDNSNNNSNSNNNNKNSNNNNSYNSSIDRPCYIMSKLIGSSSVESNIHTNDTDGNDNDKLPLLSYESILEVFSYIHHHYQYIITKNGIDGLVVPSKLSIYAILNARYMEDFKAVLLGQSFRERTWPIVKSSRAYDDGVPWLKANGCPYIYDAETVEIANEYGIYRYVNSGVYEGEWRDGKAHGQGKYTYAHGSVHEGSYKDDKKEGFW